MTPLIDAHLDLAWNAVEFERDLTATADQVNGTERELNDSRARGGAVVTLEEMRRGEVWLCFGTLLARVARAPQAPQVAPYRIHLDHRQQWGAYCAAHAQLAWYRKMESQQQIRLLTTRSELDVFWCQRQINQTCEVGVVLAMEGADPIVDLADLDAWYAAGLRQINLVHYGTNRYAAGTGAVGGLTDEGRRLLDRCSQLGLALDTTHLADDAFFEATERFAGPLLASHQNCRALVPGGRQFTDRQLKVVIDRGGVIGAALDNWMLLENWKTGTTPRESVSLDAVADQIDRVCQLAGHHRAAAIGTDLDGGFGREQAPHGVDRIGDVQKLAEILSRRHYPDHAIEAVFHGNWLRWLRESLPAGEPLSAITSNQLPTASESKIVVNTSHRYKVVVIGAGSIGERHARCFVRTGRAEISLCDVSDSRLSEVASRLTVDRCITQFESVLDAGFDAAVVATPAPLHIPQTKQLLKCGMAVLIEKPLSTTSDGVSELMAIAANQRVAVAYVLRFHSVVAGLQHAVAAGEIGEPLEIMVQSGQHFPFYRPAYRDTYYALRASGGGAIQDALTHFVNAAEWIVGPLTQVQADAQRLVLEGVEVEDTVHVVARHGRVMASYVLNQHQASNESTMTIVGSHGMLRGELHTNTIRLQHTPQEPAKVRTLEVVDRDELFVRQAHSLLDCIEFNRPPVCSLSEAAQTLSAQLAILQVSDNPQWKQVETIHSQHHCSSADPFVERPVRMSPPTCF